MDRAKATPQVNIQPDMTHAQQPPEPDDRPEGSPADATPIFASPPPGTPELPPRTIELIERAARSDLSADERAELDGLAERDERVRAELAATLHEAHTLNAAASDSIDQMDIDTARRRLLRQSRKDLTLARWYLPFSAVFTAGVLTAVFLLRNTSPGERPPAGMYIFVSVSTLAVAAIIAKRLRQRGQRLAEVARPLNDNEEPDPIEVWEGTRRETTLGRRLTGACMLAMVALITPIAINYSNEGKTWLAIWLAFSVCFFLYAGIKDLGPDSWQKADDVDDDDDEEDHAGDAGTAGGRGAS